MTYKYLIRKIAFHYSDDCYYFHSMGIIIGEIYNDYQEAYEKLMNLEREAYFSTDLGDIEPFFSPSDLKFNMINLKHYLDNEIGLKILKTDDYGRIYAPRETYLTKEITNEQLDKIRYLSGLKFYELVQFTDEPHFFGIWKKNPFYAKEEFKESYGSVYFYNSYIDAYNDAIENLYWANIDTEINGSLEDITDTPAVLKSVLKGSYSIIYDEDKKKLKIYNTPSKNEWATLCTLLKNKPFEIKVFSIDDVKNCEQSAYECM